MLKHKVKLEGYVGALLQSNAERAFIDTFNEGLLLTNVEGFTCDATGGHIEGYPEFKVGLVLSVNSESEASSIQGALRLVKDSRVGAVTARVIDSIANHEESVNQGLDVDTVHTITINIPRNI